MIVYILILDKPVFKTHTHKTKIVNEIYYVGISLIIINNIDTDSCGFLARPNRIPHFYFETRG
jgi:hypothetical protein